MLAAGQRPQRFRRRSSPRNLRGLTQKKQQKKSQCQTAWGPRPQRFLQLSSPRLTHRLSKKKTQKKGPGAFVNDHDSQPYTNKKTQFFFSFVNEHHLASANTWHKNKILRKHQKQNSQKPVSYQIYCVQNSRYIFRELLRMDAVRMSIKRDLIHS
jgi:hypothetical protein